MIAPRFLPAKTSSLLPGKRRTDKSLLAAPGDKRTPKLTNVGASNDDLGHPQAASLRHRYLLFLGSVRGTGCHPRRSKSNHKTGHFAANAAFCRLIFLQLPSSQLDMAEACGSRTNMFRVKCSASSESAFSVQRRPFEPSRFLPSFFAN